MFHRARSVVPAIAFATLSLLAVGAPRLPEVALDEPQVRRFVLKLRDGPENSATRSAEEYLGKVTSRLGVAVRMKSVEKLGAIAVESVEPLTSTEARDLLARWVRDPDLLWVEQAPEEQWIEGQSEPMAEEAVEYIVVKSRETAPRLAAKAGLPPEQDFESALSAAAGLALRHHAAMSGDAHVYRLPESMPYRLAWQLAKRLEYSGLVEYADPSIRATQSFVPNDPSYASLQWHYKEPVANNLGGANLPPAWDVTLGSSTVVVSVLDSGIATGHPDFLSQLVSGYDFVSNATNSGDGGGRDADPTDPGLLCDGKSPTWHGTHVAGTIGAATNNGIGVAGVAPNVKLQPLRVFDVCGAGDSFDIADAIRWSAGGAVPGAPNNPTPARVMNLSIGTRADVPCSSFYQDAINFAIQQGVVVIVSAGNDKKDVALSAPANCNGVIRVAAHGRGGDATSYTNRGITLPMSISAPGGEVPIDGGIYSTVGPATYKANNGTSMAAPHVAGVAALIRSAFPGYTVNDVKGVFLSSSREFAAATYCYVTGYCGQGLLDAYNAVTDRTNLTILFEGSGTVTSAPAGISCTSNCGYYVPYSPSPTYTLTAMPAAGYVFLGWSGVCSGTSTCSYTPSYSKTVVARFALAGNVFSLSVAKNGTGTGVVASSPIGINCGGTCSYNYGGGATVVLAAIASSDSVFSGWSGACSGALSTCVVGMTAARSVTATFTSLDDYPNTAVQAVAIQPVSSTPGTLFSGTDEDWFKISFATKGRWTIRTNGTTDTVGYVYAPDGTTLFGSDDDSGGAPNFAMTFTVNGPQAVLVRVVGYRDLTTQSTGPYTLVSTFTPTETLSVLKSGAGSGVISSSPVGISCGATCSNEFEVGSLVTLTAAPARGSFFAGWSGACSGSASCQVTMNIAKDVFAVFLPAAGTPALSAAPTALAFSGQSMMTTAPVQMVTFTNTGGSPLTVSSVTTSANYAVTHNCSIVDSGSTCTASVSFTPTTEGLVSGTLTVQSDFGTYTVALAGIGERSLVTHYYRSILRRGPDAGGKLFWESEATRMASLGANVNETWFAMATFFYFSPEYAAFGRTDTEFVTDLYNTFFNRGPDAGGLAFWTGQIAGGVPREIVLVSFMFSNEFQTFTQGIFGNTAARKEVDTVVDFYRGLLSRLPDTGGFNFWVQQFRTAQCQGAAAVNTQVESISSGFANSGEYAARARTNAQYVGDLYNSFLRRGGDQGGVLFWIGQLNGGATRNAIRQQFIASPEFQSRVAAIIAQGCLQ